ncbi:MAG TPA: DUF885 domain-containing protein [Terriglobales bacterium]|nr:DUF885 domain-containing protein [Terriglobales bacterium]
MKITLVCVALALFASAQSSNMPGRDTDWDRFVDQFFADYFRLNPTQGTAAGFHEYDSSLEDYSRKGVGEQIAFANKYLSRLKAFQTKNWPLERRQDFQLVQNSLNSSLLQLETIRDWQKNPDYYSSNLSQSVYGIMSRQFAPPEKRLESLIAREQKLPAALMAGKQNLKNPPRVFTEVTLEQLPGIIGFFDHDVPSAFTSVKDARLLSEFRNSNAAVVKALRDYQRYLHDKLLPASGGDFRVGTETYRKKLLYDEMVDQPLEALLKIGYDDLHRNQEWFRRTAHEIDPNRSPEQILVDMQKDHPNPDKLLQAVRDQLEGIRRFIVDQHIVTLPSTQLPIVQETPPFARALSSASMDTPGPYENIAKEAYFNVTLPEGSWPKDKIESFMGGFNRETIITTSIHEVFPGHYTQFLWLPAAPSKVRKLLGCGTNGEGWAHYAEQMMLDEGLGAGDPRLRLGQLQDALLRDARFIVGISMHTGSMSLDDAIAFFQKEGYQPESIARMEAKRGTSDPTYLVYTLGKLQILKLREDYKQARGAAFSLQDFHDRFLKEGYPPIKMVREALLGESAGVD